MYAPCRGIEPCISIPVRNFKSANPNTHVTNHAMPTRQYNQNHWYCKGFYEQNKPAEMRAILGIDKQGKTHYTYIELCLLLFLHKVCSNSILAIHT